TFPHLARGMEGVPEAALWGTCIRGGALARLGDAAGAAHELTRIRGRLPALGADLLALAAEMAALAGTREDRQALRARVEPLIGRHVVSGHVPMTYEGPWLRVAGLLDSSLGDHGRAAARLAEALAGAR